MSPITNLSSIQRNDIERPPPEVKSRTNFCSPRIWQNIGNGTIVLATLGSLALLTYGIAINNPTFAYIGGGSGIGIPAARCLLNYLSRYTTNATTNTTNTTTTTDTKNTNTTSI